MATVPGRRLIHVHFPKLSSILSHNTEIAGKIILLGSSFFDVQAIYIGHSMRIDIHQNNLYTAGCNLLGEHEKAKVTALAESGHSNELSIN